MPNTKATGVAYEDPQLDAAIIGKSGGTAGFFGVTPVTQPATISTVAVVALTTSNITGLTTTQVAALNTTLSNVNTVIANLKTLGLNA